MMVGAHKPLHKNNNGFDTGQKCDSVLFKEWRAIGQQPWCVPNFVVMHRLKDGRMPSKIGKKVVFYIDCRRVGCPAT
jgi:hypothetical protein